MEDSRPSEVEVGSALLVAAVSWLAEGYAPRTVESYSEALGLPYLVAGWGLEKLAGELGRKFGVVVEPRVPTDRAVAPGVRFGPWVTSRRINFADCQEGARAVREWAGELVRWEREPVRRLGRSVRNVQISAVCSLYRSLRSPGVTDAVMVCDPCAALNRRALQANVRQPERPRRLLTLAELGRLVAVASRYRTTETERRRLAAQVVLLVTTGRRLNALVGLTLDDYTRHRHGATLRFREKNRTSELRSIGPRWAEIIDRYLEWRPPWDLAPLPNGEPAPLFRRVARSELERPLRRPMSAGTLQAQLKRCARLAGLGSISPHDIRRSAITHALDLGFSTRSVQSFSGHQSVTTVERYDLARRAAASPVAVEIGRTLIDAVADAERELASGAWRPGYDG